MLEEALLQAGQESNDFMDWVKVLRSRLTCLRDHHSHRRSGLASTEISESLLFSSHSWVASFEKSFTQNRDNTKIVNSPNLKPVNVVLRKVMFLY